MSLSFAEAKKKIDDAKREAAKAEGVMEQIAEGWEKDHGVKTPEEIDAVVADLDAKIETVDKKYREALKELGGILGEEIEA
jgi:hypothetical protein